MAKTITDSTLEKPEVSHVSPDAETVHMSTERMFPLLERPLLALLSW